MDAATLSGQNQKASIMITSSKQVWQVGEVVKVGFLQLRIIGREATPGDYKPDAYILCGMGKNADRKYRFVPHNGLERLSNDPVNSF